MQSIVFLIIIGIFMFHCQGMKISGNPYIFIVMLVLLCSCNLNLYAQCPLNIGFEAGGFGHWTCDSSTVFNQRPMFNVPNAGPTPKRHTIIFGDYQKDPYAGFPMICPNGSRYSIRLGNDEPGGRDGVSYTMTVPADKNEYSIIYNYALVLQNPKHTVANQPNFTARVFDVSTRQYLECSSFEFAADSTLPGFQKAAGAFMGADIYYKTWTPVTIKLLGYAGKELRIEFIVKDCGEGGHFGYAYLDVNEDCTSPIKGNIVCEGSSSTILTAPFGFKEYRWFSADFGKLLGSGNTLALAPAPAPKTKIALEIKPYPGSGCVDTLFTTIEKSPTEFIFKVTDSIGGCAPATLDLTAAAITAGSSANLSFGYFTDSTQLYYVSAPDKIAASGTYQIKAVNSEGCTNLKPVVVAVDDVPDITVSDPPVGYAPSTVNIADPALVSGGSTGLKYFYWKDAAASVVVPDPSAVNTAGVYYIEAKTKYGCNVIKPLTVTIKVLQPPNVFSPNNDGIHDTWEIPGLNVYTQCTVDVYDRYGGRVFHSVGYSKPFDGYFNNKPLPVGTYYYVIRLSDSLSKMAGSVTLIR